METEVGAWVCRVLNDQAGDQAPDLMDACENEQQVMASLAWAERWQVVLPFLNRIKKSAQWNQIPEAVRLAMDERLRRERLLRSLLDEEFDRLALGLTEEELSPTVLGDLHLARTYYPLAEDRQVDEIRLRVDPDQYHPVLKVAGRLGYRSIDDGMQEALSVKLFKNPMGPRVTVLMSSQRDPRDSDRARRIEIPGVRYPVLGVSAEEHVRERCLSRNFSSLRSPVWMLDLRWLLSDSDDWNWDRLARDLIGTGASLKGAYTFRFVGNLYGVTIPEMFLSALMRDIGMVGRLWVDRAIRKDLWKKDLLDLI